MVDWMVEVMTTFKCSDQAFFLAVDIMDRYFAKVERKIELEELHITGITSMFIASKYEDVYPLLMKTVVQKIGHNKIPQSQILKCEQEILQTLGFRVGAKASVIEFLDRYLQDVIS